MSCVGSVAGCPVEQVGFGDGLVVRPFAGFRIVGYVDAPVFHIEGPVGWFGLVVSGEYEEFAIVFKGGCVCGIVVLRQVVGGIGSFVLPDGVAKGCRQRTVVDLCDGDVGIADRQIVVGVSGDAGRGTCVGRVGCLHGCDCSRA